MNSKTIENLNKWRDEQLSSKIKLNKIALTDPIHLQTKAIHFNGRIDQLNYANGRPVPIVVKKVKNKYQLLFGLKQLIIAKLLNNKTIDAIIVPLNRSELTNYINTIYDENTKLVKLSDVKISKDFAETTPNKQKIKTKRQLIKQGIIEPIELDFNDVLTDGYITYLLLKEMGLKSILATQKGGKADDSQ